MTDQIEVSRFAQEVEWTAGPQDKEWINAEMTCDQDSIWLLLFSKKNRLVHYSKLKKKLTVTPYMSGSFLIRNSNEAELPPWTYVEHISNQIFPMSHDAVETRKTVNATILLLKSGKKDVYTEINGFWAPEVEFDYTKRTYGIPSNIQHVFSKYPTYSRASLTYDENLWLVAYSRDDDGSIYNLIKIPMISGNPEVCKIRPTFGDKVNYSIAGIRDAFELLGMLIFGH